MSSLSAVPDGVAPDLPTATRESLEAFAHDLRVAQFTVDGLRDLFGPTWAAVERSQAVPARRWLDARRRAGVNSTLDTLAALFILGDEVSAEAAEAALPTLSAAAAHELGLLRRDQRSGGTVAAVDARPHTFTDPHGSVEWVILSDQGELSRGDELAGDYVLGVGGATRTLASAAVTDPVESVLDLGTGCGVLAMLATRYADRVVATDISHRALHFAAMNCALNGVTGVDFRRGSLFEPVAGERFDRVLSNPPFVITPRAAGVPEYEYRDGGMVGDALVRSVVAGVPAILAPGGVAQLLANWEYRAEAGGDIPVLEWMEDDTAGVWAVERERQSPDEYAETWIRDGGVLPRTVRYEELYALWLRDFEERAVTEIGFGYVVVTQPKATERPGSPLRRGETLRGPLGNNPLGLGASIARSLEAERFLAVQSDDDLAHLRCLVSPDVTEHRHYLPGEDDPAVIQLVQGGGFGRTVSADTALAACVGACDGELSVGAIARALAELLSADERELQRALFPRIRDLIRDGFLLEDGAA